MNVSKFIFLFYIGIYIDVLVYFIKDGKIIDKFFLEYLIGEVKVFEVYEDDKIIREFFESKNIDLEDRIFFKIKNF